MRQDFLRSPSWAQGAGTYTKNKNITVRFPTDRKIDEPIRAVVLASPLLSC